ncbi:pyridoxal phosphate-dependent aminotransferase family protein [Flagellimonas crocea]|uniref:pyridoxal phosphate-dependent aminotransferase family protein n=1 Tax=Flagellimonas crocea TaxID=3067311 RepID=UPI00296ED0A0|nr:pyridoxal phosphate-dependent aminotransferase family protein [Muricauda sp. DH64]
MTHTINSIPDRQVLINGKPHLYFGGTAYLGLQNYPPFKDLFLKNVSIYGMHYGASRKSNVALGIYEEAERFLARWAGSESCLTMSSGYLAAQLTVQTLLEKGHPVIAAPHAHAALLVNGVKTTNTFEALNRQVSKEIDKDQLPVVLFDTIDFSGGQYPSFDALKTLPLEKIILVGDDSHGIGVVGNNGEGCYAELKKLNAAKLLVCCSLGKGLGIQAGAIFSTDQDIEMLRNTSFYGGASPAPPSFMGTLINAGDLYSKRLETLKSNYLHFKGQLKNPSFFNHMNGHPTFEFSDATLAKSLEEKGFIITNFNYPDAKGPLVSRIVLSAYHTKEDVQQLVNCLNTLL